MDAVAVLQVERGRGRDGEGRAALHRDGRVQAALDLEGERGPVRGRHAANDQAKAAREGEAEEQEHQRQRTEVHGTTSQGGRLSLSSALLNKGLRR